jgi:hypothetical protein
MAEAGGGNGTSPSKFNIFVNTQARYAMKLHVEASDTIATVRNMIEYKSGAAPQQQSLGFDGGSIDDHRTLADCSIHHKSFLVMMRRQG